MLLIMSLATTLVLALAILSVASAETFQVDWDFIPDAPFDVKVGDTVAFTWLSELHDIYIHPTLDCTDTGAIAVYAPATQGGSPTYTFSAEDASPGGNDMFFACDIGTHCSANVNLAVKVFPADAAPEVSAAPTAAPVDVVTPETPAPGEVFQVDWDFIPDAPLDVKVGDTVAFTWLSELHDIYIHPTLDCTDTGAIAVYAPATQGGYSTYTFTPEDASPGGIDMFFACEIGTHCSANVNLAVKVFPADVAPEVSTAPTTAPVDVVTPPPVEAPTDAPVGVVTPLDAPAGDVVTPPPVDAPTEAPVGIVAPTLTSEDVLGETDAPNATPTDAAPTTRSINIGFLGIVAMAVVFAF
jgi:plastocyanin